MTIRKSPSAMFISILVLLGAFAFAFVTCEAVHEVGHFLFHRIYGGSVAIRLDPFGGSRIVAGETSPAPMGTTSLAGPLFSVFVSALVLLIIWRPRELHSCPSF